MLSNVTVDAVEADHVAFTWDYGLSETIPCDSVMVALPVSTHTALKDSVAGSVAEAYAIGNANEYGLIREAIRDGNLLARYL